MTEYEEIRKGLFGNRDLPDSSGKVCEDAGYHYIEAQKLWLERRYGVQFAYRVQSTAIEFMTDSLNKPIPVQGKISQEQERQRDALLAEIVGAKKTPNTFRINI